MQGNGKLKVWTKQDYSGDCETVAEKHVTNYHAPDQVTRLRPRARISWLVVKPRRNTSACQQVVRCWPSSWTVHVVWAEQSPKNNNCMYVTRFGVLDNYPINNYRFLWGGFINDSRDLHLFSSRGINQRLKGAGHPQNRARKVVRLWFWGMNHLHCSIWFLLQLLYCCKQKQVLFINMSCLEALVIWHCLLF